MRSFSVCLFVGAAILSGCREDEKTIASLTFAAPAVWAEPIADYITAGTSSFGSSGFMSNIHDLAVQDNRLYLGYGDANVNMGRVTPIEFRFYGAPSETAVSREFESDEEQLERYRLLDGTLYLAGVDATEDAFIGNVYGRSAGGSWSKSRTLAGGIHVHDIAKLGDTLFAVGSGADNSTEYNAGDIYGYLWSSADGGANFSTLARVSNDGVGDSRLVRMLAVGDTLYLFGYQTDAGGTIDRIPNATTTGTTLQGLADDHAFRWVLATDTDFLSDDLGLVRGVDASVTPLVARAWRVDAAGAISVVEDLVGSTVIDVFTNEATGETILATVSGDAWGATHGIGTVTIWLTTDFESFTNILEFGASSPPTALAFWQDGLYFGTQDGAIVRALGSR